MGDVGSRQGGCASNTLMKVDKYIDSTSFGELKLTESCKVDHSLIQTTGSQLPEIQLH